MDVGKHGSHALLTHIVGEEASWNNSDETETSSARSELGKTEMVFNSAI
jgi:hypothetical protein